MAMEGKRYESNVMHKHQDNSKRPRRGNTRLNTPPPPWLVEAVEDSMDQLRHNIDMEDAEESAHVRDTIVESVHEAMKARNRTV